MTVLMTTNYADGRHRGQTGEQGIQGERGRERPWHDALRPSLSVRVTTKMDFDYSIEYSVFESFEDIAARE